MATTPLTLTPLGGPPYSIVSGRLMHYFNGAWVADVDISANDLQRFGMPSGKCVLLFGGTAMSGTIDKNSSGMFGPIGRARIVAGAGAWDTIITPIPGQPPGQDWHADNGVLSTNVYQATATAIGETLVDLVPTFFNVDFVRSDAGPASAVFRDNPWFVDTKGITNVGPRPPAIADPSLQIRDFDPITQKITFSSSTLLYPGTTLIDTRFSTPPTVYDVEQVFDGSGSIGWAYSGPQACSQLVTDLKSATLYWTRAPYLRVYRYRLVSYVDAGGPGGGPPRMGLQAVNRSAGIPDILPITPFSGVAGMVSQLAPSQEVLVIFENADPTLPRVIGYSLVSGDGQPLGLPLTTTMDAAVMLKIGPTVPMVQIAGGTGGPLVLASAYEALLAALATFATASSTATTAVQIATAAGVLQGTLASLPAPATLRITGA